MRLSAATTALIVLFMLVFIWLALLQWFIVLQREDIYLLRSTSVGLSRADVVRKLGEPTRAYRSDEYVTGGEVLVYASSVRPARPSFLVVVDRNGRVALVKYLNDP